ADRLPKGFAIVQVIRNDRAVLARSFHGFDRDLGRGFRKSTENSASMEPARALFAEDVVPVNVAAPKLRYRGVAPVGGPQRGSDSEASLCEIQTITHGAANSVVSHPAHQALVHASLIHQVFDQASDGIVGERSHNRGVQPEAALQAARNVVLSA